jgi:membrane-bound lytic murein transglycosylase B
VLRSTTPRAGQFREWQAVAEFEEDMVARHGSGATRSGADRAGELHRFGGPAGQSAPPASRRTEAYRARFVEPVRIDAGVAFWNEHAAALARAEVEYGVPADVIVGIIGVETVYGRNTGRFRVMDVLTTLAFAYPETPNRAARMAFFRGELENTLLLARKSDIDPLSLVGSFAGAVGLPQFMPGSILSYGVDFDGDGRIDLRDSAVDAIGSVANFLVRHGWRAEIAAPFAYPASVSDSRAWEGLIGQGLAAKFSAGELAAAGARSESARRRTAVRPDRLRMVQGDQSTGGHR